MTLTKSMFVKTVEKSVAQFLIWINMLKNMMLKELREKLNQKGKKLYSHFTYCGVKALSPALTVVKKAVGEKLLWDCDDRSYTFDVSVSNDRKNWKLIVRKDELSRSWQFMEFEVLFVKVFETNVFSVANCSIFSNCWYAQYS